MSAARGSLWAATLLPVAVLSLLLALLLSSLQEAQAQVMTTSLMACWGMEELSGVRYDSYLANHLTDNNSVGFVGSAVFGRGAYFIAANSESLSIADNAELSFSGTNDPWAILIWFSPTSGIGAYNLVAKTGGTAATTEYTISVDASRYASLTIGDGVTSYTLTENTYRVRNGERNLIIAQYVGSHATERMRLYVINANNSWSSPAKSSNTSQPNMLDAANTFQIGAGPAGYFGGWVDTVAVYNYNISNTANFLTYFINNGYGRSCADLIATGAQPTSTPTITPTATPNPLQATLVATAAPGLAFLWRREATYGDAWIVAGLLLLLAVAALYGLLRVSQGWLR